ncbi:hypothetical protein A5886_002607 [Enterococcus sp. 8G7_MSG3316]|uniref:WxL domain-containing protein n=2 Tax=Candidatus Enterococcus testudinis TaxID=1834191 RepID=A0A242A8Y2_9ENTE|nr:hypothetical protein A5886_002607 [Enterococcus sp. 8G7_MSG3316]
MFAGASGLINLDLSYFNTRTVTIMANMFADASALEKLDLSSFEMSYLANTRLNLLENTTKLATLIIGERTNLNSTNLPPVPDTDGYVGLWMYENLSSFFTSSQLMSQGANSLAGRYIWAASGGEVTVRHEDVLGNTLAPTQTITGYIEQTYEAAIQSILGWSFIEADGPLSGIFTQDKQEITLIYELADAKIHDPINPAAEIHPAHLPDTAEELKSLRIDFAPTLNFGVGTISTTDQAYYAEPLQLAEEQNERPNFVQISHFHPEQPGWRLSLQQKEQMMTSQGEALTGAVIEFTQGNLVSVHNRTRPSEYLSDFQLVPGKSTQLIKAEANQGMGTWLYPFGDTATQDQSIQLHVPAKTNPRAQTYEAILTWSLEIVP